MMDASSESAYRAQRRAFIAACEAAHVDTVARLHPSRDKDGKPLFMDSAALGPRLATRAVLAIANDATGTALAVALLKSKLVELPEDARLVLVHALDPAAFAGVPGDPAWPNAMLAAEMTEDLSRVRGLGLLPLDKEASSLAVSAMSGDTLPCVCRLQSVPDTPEEARSIIRGLFRG